MKSECLIFFLSCYLLTSQHLTWVLLTYLPVFHSQSPVLLPHSCLCRSAHRCVVVALDYFPLHGFSNWVVSTITITVLSPAFSVSPLPPLQPPTPSIHHLPYFPHLWPLSLNHAVLGILAGLVGGKYRCWPARWDELMASALWGWPLPGQDRWWWCCVLNLSSSGWFDEVYQLWSVRDHNKCVCWRRGSFKGGLNGRRWAWQARIWVRFVCIDVSGKVTSQACLLVEVCAIFFWLKKLKQWGVLFDK